MSTAGAGIWAGAWPITIVTVSQVSSIHQVPETFVMVLDLDLGKLAFIAHGQYLGIAHTGLRGKTVYPIVSCVWGHCEVTMKYVRGLAPETN